MKRRVLRRWARHVGRDVLASSWPRERARDELGHPGMKDASLGAPLIFIGGKAGILPRSGSGVAAVLTVGLYIHTQVELSGARRHITQYC